MISTKEKWKDNGNGKVALSVCLLLFFVVTYNWMQIVEMQIVEIERKTRDKKGKREIK
jgi:hypothetical protein